MAVFVRTVIFIKDTFIYNLDIINTAHINVIHNFDMKDVFIKDRLKASLEADEVLS